MKKESRCFRDPMAWWKIHPHTGIGVVFRREVLINKPVATVILPHPIGSRYRYTHNCHAQKIVITVK
jgi:hypothetical protein